MTPFFAVQPRNTIRCVNLTDDDWRALKQAFYIGADLNRTQAQWGKNSALYQELERFQDAWMRLSDEAKAWIVDDLHKGALFAGTIQEYPIETRLREALTTLAGVTGAPPNYAYRQVARELRDIWTREGLGRYAVPGRLVPDTKLSSREHSGSASVHRPNGFVSQIAAILRKFDPDRLRSDHIAQKKAHSAAQTLGEASP